MVKIAVLVSGGGTNLQAIIDAQASGKIHNGELSLVLSSREGVFALERAERAGIPAEVVSRKAYASRDDFDKKILEILREYQIELIVLAGFMCVLGKEFVEEYCGRIINVHPSLIPAFCGDGFYGLKVHQAALDYGVKVTGATVHFVNEITDGGSIILQKAVAVREDDTPEILQERVMREAEWELLPKAISYFCEGKITLRDNKAYINDEVHW